MCVCLGGGSCELSIFYNEISISKRSWTCSSKIPIYFASTRKPRLKQPILSSVTDFERLMSSNISSIIVICNSLNSDSYFLQSFIYFNPVL